MSTKPTKTTTISQSAKPTRVNKGYREFEHDLFKLQIASMQRNTSYKHLVPRFVEIEHVHFYHSINERGVRNKYTAPVGGHFHEVTFDFDQWNDDKSGLD